MRNRSKGLLIGMGGFFSAGCLASAIHLPIWPKAIIVGFAGAVVSLVIWTFMRQRKTSQTGLEGRLRPPQYPRS